MNTTFNTQALASSVSGTVPSGQTERALTQQAFKKLDSVSQGGPQAVVVNISAAGAQRAGTQPAVAGLDADGDRDGDTQATEQASEAATPKAAPAASSPAPAAAAAPAAATTTTAATTTASDNSVGGIASSSKTYDPADTNQDGKVTDQEQQAYDAKLAAQKAAAQAASNGHSAEANAALKAYAAVNQLGKNGGSAAA